MQTDQHHYELELWSSRDQKRLADITHLAQGRSFTLQRNDIEIVTFTLDLFAFEAFAASINVHPRALIRGRLTDVKVKRDGQYWFGVHVISSIPSLTNDPATMSQGQAANSASTFNPTVSVTATGYLNLFQNRYVDVSYAGDERCFIACDLVTQAQTQHVNGDVGVTLAATQYSTGITDTERNYTRQNVKSGLQNLTSLQDGRFDFSFTYDKQFQCVEQLGSVRTDLKFTYGGPDSNVAGFYLDSDGSTLYNQIIALGSGFGADQLVSVADDLASQADNFLQQDIKQYNSIEVQQTLDQNAASDLALEKDILEIPQITVTGKELVGHEPISIGDRIFIDATAHPYLDNIYGFYRVEKMVVNVDDNDFESISLYFDNFAVSD